MSLNVCEQRIYDYLQGHRDEGRHWREKIRTAAARETDERALAGRLDIELWNYYEERSAVVADFREPSIRGGVRRMSMRNLAELLLRTWVDPRPRRRREPTAEAGANNP
jgi:hypothetical protein